MSLRVAVTGRERIIERHLEKVNTPIIYEESPSPLLAALFAILGVSFSIPHLNTISPEHIHHDFLFWIVLSAASLAVPAMFAFLTFKALSSKRVEVWDTRVAVTVSRPVLPPVRWTESISEYRAIVVKRTSEGSNEATTVLLLHRHKRHRNVPIARTETELEARQLAEQYASLLKINQATELLGPPPRNPEHIWQNSTGSTGTTASQFEHIFVESYTNDGEYRFRQHDRQLARAGVCAGLLAIACALANGIFDGPVLLTIVCGLIAALSAASVFRGALTYDYIRITSSGIASGTCICGSDHEQTFIPAAEVEDVVIFEDDLEKYPAVHIMGKEAVICFGGTSSDQELQWLKQYVEENFPTTSLNSSDLI